MKYGGTAEPSFGKFILENQKQFGLQDNEMVYAVAGIFGAGSDAVGFLLHHVAHLTPDNFTDCFCNHDYDDGCCHPSRSTGLCPGGT